MIFIAKDQRRTFYLNANAPGSNPALIIRGICPRVIPNSTPTRFVDTVCQLGSSVFNVVFILQMSREPRD